MKPYENKSRDVYLKAMGHIYPPIDECSKALDWLRGPRLEVIERPTDEDDGGMNQRMGGDKRSLGFV